MADSLRVRLANAIAAEILRQDFVKDMPPLGDDLSLAWLDQGEVDFGKVADVVEDIIRGSEEYGR
jgi:hypothetical protein